MGVPYQYNQCESTPQLQRGGQAPHLEVLIPKGFGDDDFCDDDDSLKDNDDDICDDDDTSLQIMIMTSITWMMTVYR